MRTKYALVLVLGLTLVATGVVFCADEDEPSPAEPDVKKLAEQAGKKSWAELSKAGAAVAKDLASAKRKQLDVLPVMSVFKKRQKDAGVQGIGIGKVPGAIKPDGIEAMIINMSLNVTQRNLKNIKELIRMTEITAAVAGIATHMPNEKAKKTPDDIMTWQKYSKEMHDASLDLAKVLKQPGVKPAAVKTAFKKLQDTCTKCHSEYRAE